MRNIKIWIDTSRNVTFICARFADAVAFELNLDDAGDNTLGAPKRVPKRLRRLDPIAALPKISMSQLQDQLEAADLKRKRVCNCALVNTFVE